MDVYDPHTHPAPKQGMGCFAKGCITLVVVGILLAGLVAFAGYQGYRSISAYLAERPANIRVYPATEEQYQAVLQKMAPFANALETNRRETLELTADDLNTLVARDPRASELKGRAAFAIAQDELSADVSMPVNGDAKRGKAATKFFNGHLGLGVSLDQGEFAFQLNTVVVNGKPLPGWTMQVLQSKDFAKGFNRSFNQAWQKDPKAQAVLNKLRSVRVAGDRLVLTSVGEEPVAPTPVPR